MSITGKHTGAVRFARILTERMNQHIAAENGQRMSFGRIESGYNLRVNNFSCSFSQDGYRVCRHVGTVQSGDSVVVAWVENFPIIIGRIGD